MTSTPAATAVAAPNRRQSTRAIRTNVTRPTNYYARPFGSVSSAVQAPNNTPPGFFPAITHFSDAVTALPKEVIRHFSMLKEVEAKLNGPDGALTQVTDAINTLPPPPRQEHPATTQALLRMSTNNSATVSANVSVTGSITGAQQLPAEIADSSSQAQAQVDGHTEMMRRHLFYNLRLLLIDMMPTLDEKNVVLATANQTLSRQLARMDDVLPHVEGEISEEARCGSLTHWAYADKEAKKTAAANERTRREVAATNNLAAAAATVHENDIAATRSEARREAMLAKRSRNHQHVDSDFDDRPPAKKAHTGAKSRKTADTTTAADKPLGLGISNGITAPPPVKRKRAEKAAAAPAMERSASGMIKEAAANARLGANSPRETPVAEPHKKRTKATASTTHKKKTVAGTAQSPNLASSPIVPSSSVLKESNATSQRPQASKVRQNSKDSGMAAVQEAARNRPSSSASNRPTNGVGIGISTSELKSIANVTGRSVPEARSSLKESYSNSHGEHTVEQEGVLGALAVGNAAVTAPMKSEETTEARAEPVQEVTLPPSTAQATRAGRASKTSTPIATTFPEVPMSRSRSTRNNGSHHNSTDSIPTVAITAKRSHKKGEGKAAQAAAALLQQQNAAAAAPTSTPSLTSKPTADSDDTSSLGDAPLSEKATNSTTTTATATNTRKRNASKREEEEPPELEEDEEEEEPDEDEPRYCYCNSVSYGEMVACDNEACPREWFHLACVGLSRPPGSKTKWYCNECKEELRRARPGSRQ